MQGCVQLHVASPHTCLKEVTALPPLLTAFASSRIISSEIKLDFIKCFWETGEKAIMGVVVQELHMNS